MKQLVVKANVLVEAKYRLSLGEQRIILYVLSEKVKKDDEHFGVYTFNLSELIDVFGGGTRNFDEVIETIHKLRRRIFFYRDGDTWIDANWVSVAIVNEHTKDITIEFPQLLKPYLLQLKSNFTSYRLENVVYLKSSYAVRIFELLKQYVKIGSRTFTVDELKELIGIDVENEYIQYGHFKAKVLNVSIEQINENSDIHVEMFPVKKGRKVESLRFLIKSQTIRRETQLPSFEDKPFEHHTLFDDLIKYGCSPSEAEKYLKTYPKELVERNLKYCMMEDEKGNVGNKRGYIKSALDRDFAFPSENSTSKKDLQETKKNEMVNTIQRWKDGDHSKEIEVEIENYYKDAGNPQYFRWKDFV